MSGTVARTVPDISFTTDETDLPMGSSPKAKPAGSGGLHFNAVAGSDYCGRNSQKVNSVKTRKRPAVSLQTSFTLIRT